MATYYVRTDGSDSNAGTGPATNQAWQTITKAIGATGIAPGDTLYIAPGVYRGAFTAAFTNPTSEGQRITIAGNPTASLFSGVNAGPVVLTNYTNTTTSTGTTGLTISKNFITLNDLCFINSVAGGASLYGTGVYLISSSLIVNRCLSQNRETNLEAYGFHVAVPSDLIGPIITNSIFIGGVLLATQATASYNCAGVVNDCLFIRTSTASATSSAALTFINSTTIKAGGYTIANNTFYSGGMCIGVFGSFGLSTTIPSLFTNNYFRGSTGISMTSTASQSETYNIFECVTDRVNVNTGTGSVSKPQHALDMHISKIQGWSTLPFLAPITGSYGIGAGSATSAPATDMFGVTWLTLPTIGSTETSRIANQYLPSERNASTITIAPGSTSQSIELYLGATGLTASTSGLSARYNRTRTASVDIPLVARTIGQAWLSGGFAEVDSVYMPGVYRLDLPDLALAAGADDVTVVVRGASGTNGAVMTIKLSSGGLTAAQTAAAVWDEATASHTTHGTYGWNTLRADAQSKQGLVTLHSSGGINRVDADVHAIVNDTDAATELKGALLHNGTDYISADLLTPVSAATSVHIGPYQLLADGLGADQPLDVNVGTATSIDVQVTDANGTGIDITGATTSAKVYSSAGTLVATYAGTATYADNGRLSFGLTTTVTSTSGTYTVTVTRTTGATDTQIFGPLRLYVRPA
jgi:hypothetical protein